jgi:SpoVK/Ycf46/Vps4 family AAA+-type ATPase
MGRNRSGLAVALPDHYDPAFLNTNSDLITIAAGLSRDRGARLCLYGPSGTGKTAFAHYLCRTLDLPVLVKRGSELISMWVGQTEELIAAAFRQARDSSSILVIDEADGFLRDRSGAQRSWEVTQVNELLTQMEAFEGIFVASTNLIDTLDAASLRRFDFMVKFDYLTREQRRAMLSRICPAESPHAAVGAYAAIDRLDALAPGDFAAVQRQLRVTGKPPDAETVVALLAAKVALKPECRVRRIGFVQ